MQGQTRLNQNKVHSRRVIGGASIVVGMFSVVFGLSAGSGLAYTGPEQLPSTSASNSASYWGPGCSKLDRPGGTTWTANADYSIVVLKAAQTDWVFRDVQQGDVLTVGQQAISHFIFCTVAATTTTTVPQTTTTVPQTSTTVPQTSTTVPQTTTTVPQTTTTVPQTTTTVPQTTTTVPQTTTTVPQTTTTAVASQGPTTTVLQTTTTAVASQGPTTTAAVASQAPTTTVSEQTTTSLAASAGPTSTIATQLPATGSELHRSLSVLGALLISFGGTMLLITRRTAAT